MAYDGRKITGEVSIYDVQRATGNYTTRDVGNLCLGRNINKWSKHKPVDRAKLTPLADGDAVGGFRGRGIGGECYGLICSTAEFTLSVALHDVAFTYIGPKGGINSPYRLSDFSGYDSLAEPDPIGDIHSDEVYWKDELVKGSTMLVEIKHYEWNGTGVSLNDILSGGVEDWQAVSENMANCYPLMMIGGRVRCLQNESKPVIGVGHVGEYQCTTLGTTNSDGSVSWWQRWVLPIEALKEVPTGTQKATVMLFYPKDDNGHTIIDICKTRWYDIPEGNVQAVRAFPVPEAVGKLLTVKQHVGPAVSVMATTAGVTAVLGWPGASDYDDGSISAGDRFSVSVGISGSKNGSGDLVGGKFTFEAVAPARPSGAVGAITSEYCTWQQLAMAVTQGARLYYTWSVSRNNIQLGSGDGSMIVSKASS